MILREGMSAEELQAAATKLKSNLSKATKNFKRLEKRYVDVLKERKAVTAQNKRKSDKLGKMEK